MVTSAKGRSTQRYSARWFQRGYAALAGMLALGLTAQIFLAGLNVFLQPRYWALHIQLGHALGGAMLLLTVLAFIGRLPWRVRLVTLGMLALFAYQYNARAIGSTLGVPGLAALHAVNGLLLFWGAVTLAGWAWRLARA